MCECVYHCGVVGVALYARKALVVVVGGHFVARGSGSQIDSLLSSTSFCFLLSSCVVLAFESPLLASRVCCDICHPRTVSMCSHAGSTSSQEKTSLFCFVSFRRWIGLCFLLGCSCGMFVGQLCVLRMRNRMTVINEFRHHGSR